MNKTIKKVGTSALALAMAASLMPYNGGTGRAYTVGNYSFDDEYTLGYFDKGVVAYQNGEMKSLEEVGATVYNKKGDNIFKSEKNQAWDADVITLTQPIRYTTEDGEAHDVESMLTGFDFIADPTAIDNSEVDGKLYVYGTTEGFTYNGDTMVENKYANHSLTILSTSDMVNWTDEGFMDSHNLTNLPSTADSSEKTRSKFTSGASWAPSGLKIDGDGDGEDEYYLFYTNGGGVGYVMSDSPVGPWVEPRGKELCNKSLPNCGDCANCFDPGVLADDKGNAYVYFGGLSRTSARVVKIKFMDGTGEVELDGEPVKLPAYAMFEDNEINQFNGKYYYSYCSDFEPDAGHELTDTGSICVYVSSDPLNVAFDPTERPKGEEFAPFTETDENGNEVYHHYLGTVLKNTATIYGNPYNNHHHMQEFKKHTYIFYHSTVLHDMLHKANCKYRNLHVDEITVNEETDEIRGKAAEPDGPNTVATYEGAEQIEWFNPYYNLVPEKSGKYINATTTSYSAGVKSTLSDAMTIAKNEDGLLNNGSPMVLDEIDTGDWTKIEGVDLGNGPVKFEAVIGSETAEGAIEVFLDDPTKASNCIAKVNVKDTGSVESFSAVSTDITESYTGIHDLYFVFRGSDYRVAAWKFTENPVAPPTPTPAPTDAPAASPAADAAASPTAAVSAASPTAAVTDEKVMDYTKTYKIGKLNYKLSDKGTAAVTGPANKNDKSASIPAVVKVEGKAYKVTSIAPNAFSGAKSLSGVTIGKNVSAIGSKAFYNCSALKKITVKSAVIKSVGKNALKGTASRLTIKVPKNKLKAYKKIFKGRGQGGRARIR